MIGVIRTCWANLRRDPLTLLLGYVVPLVFFSVYVGVASLGRLSLPPVAAAAGAHKLAIVDHDGTDMSRRLVQLLRAQPGLLVQQGPYATTTTSGDGKAVAPGQQNDDVAALLVVPKGFAAAPLAFLPAAAPARLELVLDADDKPAAAFYGDILQRAILALAPSVFSATGQQSVDGWVGGLTPPQHARLGAYLDGWRKMPGAASGLPPSPATILSRNVPRQVASDPTVAFYAAAMGVMTILFTAAGAATALIEENESGMLARVLSSRLSLSRLFRGKLVFTALLCLSQLAAIFLWGAMMFHLDILPHLGGWFVVSLATSLAAAAFSLALAAFCRTRARFYAMSGLIVLAMGALGGSMFPRFLMPKLVQGFGLLTFNAWAIDGFTKVFWLQLPLTALWPQITALLAFTLLFFGASLWLARRWACT